MSIMIDLLFLLECIVMIVIFAVSVTIIYFIFNSSFHNAPPVPSSGKTKKAIIEDMKTALRGRCNQSVLDLGSGWGGVLLELAENLPNHHFMGIEYGWLPYLVSKFRARKLNNLTFCRKNFFDVDISNADMIFMFLFPLMMSKVEEKCLSEVKSGALIYVNRFPMPTLKFSKKVFLGSKYDTYFIYEMK